jgi:hypothetical protein
VYVPSITRENEMCSILKKQKIPQGIKTKVTLGDKEKKNE